MRTRFNDRGSMSVRSKCSSCADAAGKWNAQPKVKGTKCFIDRDKPESAPILGLLGSKGNIFFLVIYPQKIQYFLLHSFGLGISGVSQRLSVLSQSLSSSTQTVSASPDGRVSVCEPAAEWKDPCDLIQHIREHPNTQCIANGISKLH